MYKKEEFMDLDILDKIAKDGLNAEDKELVLANIVSEIAQMKSRSRIYIYYDLDRNATYAEMDGYFYGRSTMEAMLSILKAYCSLLNQVFGNQFGDEEESRILEGGRRLFLMSSFRKFLGLDNFPKIPKEERENWLIAKNRFEEVLSNKSLKETMKEFLHE